MSGEHGNEMYRWRNGGIHLYIILYIHDYVTVWSPAKRKCKHKWCKNTPLVFLYCFLSLIFFSNKQAASVEVFNLHACPRRLRGGFYLRIFYFPFFFFFAPRVPQRDFQLRCWSHMTHRGFHLDPRTIFFLNFLNFYF